MTTMPKLTLGGVLRRLLFEKQMRTMDLARKLKIPQPTLHRLVSGKSTRPHHATLEPIANFFDISVAQLKGEEPLPENLFGKVITDPNQHILKIPLIKWNQLQNLPAITNPEKMIFMNSDLPQDCFAVKLNDSSMQPQFSKGTTLIFNPIQQPGDRSFCLIALADKQHYIVRQLLIDGEHRFLKPLNPDLTQFKMRILSNNDKIIGTLVEARANFNELS